MELKQLGVERPPTLRVHERVAFEYRIDRRPRMLRRDHMFSNQLHPRGLTMDEDFFVCNSVHSHHLRTGMMFLAPGASHEFPIFPNEHHNLLMSGKLAIDLQGERVELLARGDQMFAPAFEAYTVINTGDDPTWFLSGYTRVVDWAGLTPEETPVSDELRRWSLLRAAAPDNIQGVQKIPGLEGTNVSSHTIDFAAGSQLTPQHLQVEQIVVGVEGQTSWHVDGIDYRIAFGDMLFIPALTPFSAISDERSRTVVYDISLEGGDREPATHA
ncbi:cupin domain-containing protein [Rhodococcoides fascians]|uniref:cupin domain-containing protein n=1 Tax=Rhodococcoides fascians TaxID=1828 RepID=UPI00055E91D0|nr:cupin domain-containing protein [Rhodococcus fascians]